MRLYEYRVGILLMSSCVYKYCLYDIIQFYLILLYMKEVEFLIIILFNFIKRWSFINSIL